ncbi:MAG: von Willebrand factor type A domain-containing protein, partial [Bacteroidota bacterium]
MRTLLLILTIVLPLISAGQTSGTLQGKVTDKQTKDELAFVNIVLEQNGEQIGGASSDISGKYKIAGIVPGKYDVRASFIGYTEVLIRGIQINANQIRFFDIEMQQSAELLDECVVVDYIVPLIDKDRTVSGGTVTMHEIQKMPNRSVGSTATTVGGVYSRDGETGNIRGARSKGTRHYIDGMPVVGSSSLPQSAIIHPHYDYSNESYDKIIENIFKNPVYSPLSTFSIDVDVAAYSNMRRFINEGIIPPENAIRIEELINYFSYDYPQPEGKDPFSITSELADCPWNDNLLLHVGIQGKDIEKEDLPPSNLVFLLDVSGSMSSHDKLPLLKKALKLLVSQLRKEDRISIVVYAGSSGLALPSTRGSNKEKIMHVIDYLHAGGSTAGGKGIQLAYKVARKNFMKNGNNRIILATDGDFNVGVTSDNEMVEMIKEEREHGIFLSVLGFGTGNLKDSKMEKLADHGNGNYAYIDNLLEAKKVLVSEMGGTLFTIAKDVKIQIEFNPANVIEYRLIGYENRMLAAEDFNNDRKDAGEIGAGQTVTALYEIVTEIGETPIAPIDDLRYHTRPPADETLIDELATLKIRYKEPDASVSNLIS